MDVAAVIVAVGTVALEDHVAVAVEVDQVITAPEADMAAEIVKAMVKGRTKTAIVIRATEEIATEWIVVLTTRVAIALTKATTAEVAIKATMVNATTRAAPTTDHRETEEVHPTSHEVDIVEDHLEERQEDHHLEVAVTNETHRTRKSKEDGGQTRIAPSLFCLKQKFKCRFFFYEIVFSPSRHLDSETGSRHHFQLLFFFLLFLSPTVIISFVRGREGKGNQLRMS